MTFFIGAPSSQKPQKPPAPMTNLPRRIHRRRNATMDFIRRRRQVQSSLGKQPEINPSSQFPSGILPVNLNTLGKERRPTTTGRVNRDRSGNAGLMFAHFPQAVQKRTFPDFALPTTDV